MGDAGGSPRRARSGGRGDRSSKEEEELQLSTFIVHVGEQSFTVQSTAASLAEFKSEGNMRSLRRDFAAKLGACPGTAAAVNQGQSSLALIINHLEHVLANQGKPFVVTHHHELRFNDTMRV